jgi:hypothetical protein
MGENILLPQACRPVPRTRPTTSSDDATSPPTTAAAAAERQGGHDRSTGHRPEAAPARRPRKAQPCAPATTRPPLPLVSSSTCSCSSRPPLHPSKRSSKIEGSRPPIVPSPAHGARRGSIGSAPAGARCGSRWR